MMLTPCWPSAGPTGGAGLAEPAGSCNLISPITFFIASPSGGLLDLREIQLHRCGATEDRHQHADLLLLRLDLFDRAREVRERAVVHADVIALLEHHARARLCGALFDLLHHRLNFRRG